MLDVGRPLVAILILIMCAPGEHYLATQAGWSETLAWGMPGALTAYAGIAAVVATKRPKEAPGRNTAIWGAVLSIGLAMAAQPIAHLYGRGGLDTQAIALTIAVSCIPAAVFGHLLHMGAASPKPPAAPRRVPKDMSAGQPSSDRPAGQPSSDMSDPDRAAAVQKIADAFDLPADILTGQPDWISDNQAAAVSARQSVSDLLSAPDSPPDMATWTAGPMDTRTLGHSDTVVFGQLPADSPVRDNLKIPGQSKAVRSIKSGSVAADVRRFLSEHPEIVSSYRTGQPGTSDADLSGHIRARWPEAQWDTIRKARDRYLEKIKESTA
jgi:hypothetical protein